MKSLDFLGIGGKICLWPLTEFRYLSPDCLVGLPGLNLSWPFPSWALLRLLPKGAAPESTDSQASSTPGHCQHVVSGPLLCPCPVLGAWCWRTMQRFEKCSPEELPAHVEHTGKLTICDVLTKAGYRVFQKLRGCHPPHCLEQSKRDQRGQWGLHLWHLFRLSTTGHWVVPVMMRN